MRINVKNEAGLVKQIKVGFSWTAFFFGIFVPLLRGDFLWAGIYAIVYIISWMGLMNETIVFTLVFGVFQLAFPFIYNKLYFKTLEKKGYRAASETDAQLLASKNYV